MAAVKQKKRGQVNRSRTKLILIAAEGRNKTEKLYFHELLQRKRIRLELLHQQFSISKVRNLI